RMTDQQDRPVDLINHRLEVVTVAAAQTAQRVRRGDHPHVFAEEVVVHAAGAGGIRARAVDENDSGGTAGRHAHATLPGHIAARCLPAADNIVKSPGSDRANMRWTAGGLSGWIERSDVFACR